MKKLAALILLCLCLATFAQAETFTFNKPIGQTPFMDNLNLWYEATTFTTDVPAELQPALASSPFAADAVLQGAWLREYYHRYDEKTDVLNHQAALLAVRHEGRLMLLGMAREGRTWRVTPQSETFLPEEEAFTITVKPSRTNNASAAMLAVVVGEETHLIGSGSPDTAWTLYQYQHAREDGSTAFLQPSYGSVIWGVYEGGKVASQESFRCVLPEYLETITYADLPRSLAELKDWAAAHPIVLAADEAFIGGVNLRHKATGNSRSHGQYFSGTKVKLLGQAPGTDFPWYNVRVGDTEGWVSGVYFYTEALDAQNLHQAANRIQPVARLKKATSLLTTPGGKVIASLPADSVVSVLVEQDGWAHVVAPRNEIACQADWEGTYGYLPVKVLTQAATPLQLRFTED